MPLAKELLRCKSSAGLLLAISILLLALRRREDDAAFDESLHGANDARWWDDLEPTRYEAVVRRRVARRFFLPTGRFAFHADRDQPPVVVPARTAL